MRILLVFALLTLGVSSVGASQQVDEAEIGGIQARWDDAWNRHDIKALSALVAVDVRFVNVAGNVLNGRDEFEKLQTRTHATQFKDSVRTVTGTDIKCLTPTLPSPTSDGESKATKTPTARLDHLGVAS
jgi:uncharacterized protein (TIGR02246 family)